jgi:hypothetical protein
MPNEAPSLARLQAWLSIGQGVPDDPDFYDLYTFFASESCFALSENAKDALYGVLQFFCNNFEQWATCLWLQMKINSPTQEPLLVHALWAILVKVISDEDATGEESIDISIQQQAHLHLKTLWHEANQSGYATQMYLHDYIAGGEMYIWRRILGPFGLCDFHENDQVTVYGNGPSWRPYQLIWTDSRPTTQERVLDSIEQYSHAWHDSSTSFLSTAKITRNGATAITVRRVDPERLMLMYIDDFECLTPQTLADRIYKGLNIPTREYNIEWRGYSLAESRCWWNIPGVGHCRFATSSCFQISKRTIDSGPGEWTGESHAPRAYHRHYINAASGATVEDLQLLRDKLATPIQPSP